MCVWGAGGVLTISDPVQNYNYCITVELEDLQVYCTLFVVVNSIPPYLYFV